MAKDKKKTVGNEQAETNETKCSQQNEEVSEAENEEAKAVEEENSSDKIIEELNGKLLEANDKLLRTVAEYDNFRKRSQKEKESIYADSKTDVISKLLPVIDNFERAAAATSDFENYKKGIDMTVKQLLDVLSSLGVEAFGEKGEVFDPNIHNGVMHTENEELGENTISEVYMKGYKMGDRVVRHATVIVAN